MVTINYKTSMKIQSAKNRKDKEGRFTLAGTSKLWELKPHWPDARMAEGLTSPMGAWKETQVQEFSSY
jgi:hypothetical protein